MVVEKLPFSLVIITLNEEKNLERCIRSVPMAAEIVVLDSGSQDKTVDIARRLGARVMVEPWRGYSRQKTRATALALNDWVLSLDADEALSAAAQTELTNLAKQISQLSADTAYAWPRRTFHLGRWIAHGGMYPDFQSRFFNRTKAKWLDTQVHEKIEAPKVDKLNGDILHWSFDSIAHQIETVNKYSSLRAQDFSAKGYRYSSVKMVAKTIGKFIECYFIKRGFLDGKPGLILAMVSAYATFLRWAKLYELQLKEKPASK